MAQGDWIGVDLGTTTVRATTVDAPPRTLPAIVAFSDHTRLVGAAAQERAALHPRRTLAASLRILGRRFSEPATDTLRHQLAYPLCEAHNGDVWIRSGDAEYPPPQIIAMLLSAAARPINGTDAVVVIPASFDAIRRQAVLDAARIAALNVQRLLPAPIAVALTRYQRRQRAERIAIVDLGGGHLDIAVLDLSANAIVVRGLDGDDLLGGQDLDAQLCDTLITAHDLNSEDPVARQRLREAAAQARCALSTQPSADIELPFIPTADGQSINLHHTLTREAFTAAISVHLDRLGSTARRCLHRANVNARDLSAILLVGGVAHTPAVQSVLKDIFGRAPEVPEDGTGYAVQGAALLARHLRDQSPLPHINDLNPRALMVEDEQGNEQPILLRGASLPCKHTRTFDVPRLTLFQADRALCILEMNAPLKITFALNESGCLDLRARSPQTGERVPLYPTPVGGLSTFEIDALAHDAALYQQESTQRQAWEETRSALDGLIYNTARSLEEFSDLLRSRDVRRIERILARAEAALDSDQPAQIREAHAALFKAAQLIDDQIPDLDDDF